MARWQRWRGCRDGEAAEMARLQRWRGRTDGEAAEMARLQRWRGGRDCEAAKAPSRGELNTQKHSHTPTPRTHISHPHTLDNLSHPCHLTVSVTVHWLSQTNEVPPYHSHCKKAHGAGLGATQ
eukprot:364637-Chlamydomonas_euryale.AAC.18